ncbi:MAG TPA: hypothetical protein ENJ54_05275 [Chloroflexi bacterium]|nr:hypothetical protein [Chloroflexota bacterium]
MKRSFMWQVGMALAGVAVALAACAPGASPATTPTPDATAMWQSECLQATVRALEMERQRYADWLQQASGDQAASYRHTLAYIDAALAKDRGLTPDEFRIAEVYREMVPVLGNQQGQDDIGEPQPIVLEDAWVEQTPPGLLFYAGMSRSGPFYTVVGVPGGDFGALKPGVHYRVVLQPLMPATYPFPSFYVCIKELGVVKK